MKNVLAVLVFCLSCYIVNGQVKLKSGSLDFLKDTELKLIKIKFNYDHLIVRDQPEKEYIDKITKSKDKVNDGSGEKWLIDWQSSKSDLYEPEFVKYFNCTFPKRNIIAKKNIDSAKYIMVVMPTCIDPGYKKWIMDDFGFLNTYIIIKAASKPDSILCEFKSDGIVQSGKNISNVYLRIAGHFGATGEKLAKYIIKNCQLK